MDEVVDCSAAQALAQLGGVATRAQLVALVGRRAVDRALAAGAVVAVARGRYALPTLDDSVARAHAIGGVLSLTSAALYHGWAVKQVPEQPHVTVPWKRKVLASARSGVQLHRNNLTADDICDGVATSKDLTLQQCLRRFPFDEALAVADSALRAGDETALRRAAVSAQGPGSPRIREVAAAARAEAANPFESVLRAIVREVPGLEVVPQVLITSVSPWVRPDLVDVDRRIILEADSFEWHGDRAALCRDAHRYNLLVVDGWIVLRFAWEDVMFDPTYVREVLIAVVRLVERRSEVRCQACRAA